MNGTWSAIILDGKVLDVYQPAATGKPRFGIIFLHGVGGETLRDQPAFTRVFDELNLPCVSPTAGPCWWVDRPCPAFDSRLTPEQFVRENVPEFFKQRFGMAPRSIGLLGISMGGQAALRMAFKHPQRFPAAAGIASALDYHELYGRGTPLDELYESKEHCRQDTAVLHVPPYNPPPHIFFCIDPSDDAWLRGNDRLHEKLTALGIPHTHDLTTEAGGHSWDYFNHMAEPAIRFLHQGLDQESRRLL
ncbi:MAG: esterase [Planctomycetes bacterium]|nr:esterase [Planctomycetota bacterium]